MKITDNIPTKGVVELYTRNVKTGRIGNKRKINNLVVQAGKDLIASAFAQVATETVTHIGLGENDPATPASLLQTDLVSPLSPRVAVSSTLNVGPASIVYEVTFGAGVVLGDIGEAGLFTSLTNGIMTARTTFASIPKEDDDELVITWTLIFG